MNIFSRCYGYITGVLGYDYQGKPLRKDDVVEIAPKLNAPHGAKCHLLVVRKGVAADTLRFNFSRLDEPYLVLINPDGVLACANSPKAIRKVPLAEIEPRWENVERVTGWKPQVREVKHG